MTYYLVSKLTYNKVEEIDLFNIEYCTLDVYFIPIYKKLDDRLIKRCYRISLRSMSPDENRKYFSSRRIKYPFLVGNERKYILNKDEVIE